MDNLDKAIYESVYIETLKHLQGKHDQKRHGWSYGGGIAGAKRSMRGRSKSEVEEYKRRAREKRDGKPKGGAKPEKAGKITTQIGQGRDKDRGNLDNLIKRLQNKGDNEAEYTAKSIFHTTLTTMGAIIPHLNKAEKKKYKAVMKNQPGSITSLTSSGKYYLDQAEFSKQMLEVIYDNLERRGIVK